MSPRHTHMARNVVVRKLIVESLVGLGTNADFMRAVPVLLARLAPHLKDGPVPVLIDDLPPAAGSSPALTDREIEVLALAATGLTNARIGARLGVSEDTVKTHFSRLRSKLGVHDRAEAVAVGMRRGIIA